MLTRRPGARSAVPGLGAESSDTHVKAPLSPRLSGGRHRPGAYLYPSSRGCLGGGVGTGEPHLFSVLFPLSQMLDERNRPVILMRVFASATVAAPLKPEIPSSILGPLSRPPCYLPRFQLCSKKKKKFFLMSFEMGKRVLWGLFSCRVRPLCSLLHIIHLLIIHAAWGKECRQ